MDIKEIYSSVENLANFLMYCEDEEIEFEVMMFLLEYKNFTTDEAIKKSDEAWDIFNDTFDELRLKKESFEATDKEANRRMAEFLFNC